MRAVRAGHQAWAAAGEAEAGADGGERVVNEEELMRAQVRGATVRFLLAALLGGLPWVFFVPSVGAQAASGSATAKAAMAFDAPQDAADALIAATESYDVPKLLEILGADAKDMVSSSDPVHDKSIAAGFAAQAREKTLVTIDPENKARAIISVGKNQWPLPIPIVKRGSKWYFDTKQGREEVIFRRIGANELDAIQICRGFVDAQKEYASEVHDNSGVHQYAQKIISTPGKQDGLYWQNADGTPGGPISEVIARAIEEGYQPGKTAGYHGYYFKVLKGQGAAARLGQLDYVIDGIMIGGFALVAFPSSYRITGVKSFMISYDGVVYEKDLGPRTLDIVQGMERYNPDKTWKPTSDEWPSNVSAGSD